MSESPHGLTVAERRAKGSGMTLAATDQRPGPGSRLWSLVSSRETGIFLALALVVLATTVRNPTFLFLSLIHI